MPSEALSVRFSDIHSASSGNDGVTGCNFIFLFRIAIISFNRVTLKIMLQLGNNYEVNASLNETGAPFVIKLE